MVGYIPTHKDKNKQSGTNQAWFPKDWKSKDIKRAGEHVAKLPGNRKNILMMVFLYLECGRV